MSKIYRNYGKRTLDIVASLLGLILLLPFLIIIAMLVKGSSKGPIFFTQERLGKNFKPFQIIKFRSMIVNIENKHSLVTAKGDKRITPIGKFLRRYKIDELPQLINVLKGEMSLVGPRPEVARYIKSYQYQFRQILSVSPGITDNAAIKFKNEEDLLNQYKDKEKAYIENIMPQKINLYMEYINKISFVGDIKLIVKTIF